MLAIVDMCRPIVYSVLILLHDVHFGSSFHNHGMTGVEGCALNLGQGVSTSRYLRD